MIVLFGASSHHELWAQNNVKGRFTPDCAIDFMINEGEIGTVP